MLAEIHYLNSGIEPVARSVVYDFVTMPDEQVLHTLGAMVIDDQSFRSSTTVPSVPRVAADDPAGSFLLHKLTGVHGQ